MVLNQELNLTSRSQSVALPLSFSSLRVGTLRMDARNHGLSLEQRDKKIKRNKKYPSAWTPGFNVLLPGARKRAGCRVSPIT